jgi:recombinational DNA repair protein RecT
MGKTLIKLERIITQSKEIEIEVPGDDEGTIDEMVDEYIEKNKEQLEGEPSGMWDVEDVQVALDTILEYPDFDEEE